MQFRAYCFSAPSVAPGWASSGPERRLGKGYRVALRMEGAGDRVDHHCPGQCHRRTLASMVPGHGLAGVRYLLQRPAQMLFRVLRCGEGLCGRVPGLHPTFPPHGGPAERAGRGTVWARNHRRTGKKLGETLRSNLHAHELMAQGVAMESHGLGADVAGRLLMKQAAAEMCAGMILRILRCPPGI